MGLSTVIGFFVSENEENRLLDYRYVTRDVRVLQQALVDAETGVRGYALTGRSDYLQPYFQALQSISGLSGSLLPTMDRSVAPSAVSDDGHTPISGRIAELQKIWKTVIALTADGKTEEAQAPQQSLEGKRVMDELREMIGNYLTTRQLDAEAADRRINLEQYLMLLINALGALIAVVGMSYAFWRSARDSRDREAAITVSTHAHRQITELFGMTNMLQSAIDREDANEVLRATAARLLPGFSGRLYVFNNSRDRLDLSTTWGTELAPDAPDHIAPTSCWALKSGRPHINLPGPAALRCSHIHDQSATFEIPMAARGEVYGLLELRKNGEDSDTIPAGTPAIAMALADAMSLSLSGIALRERLRNQALRDPLTGLYNRRFMEEMLDRLATDAERHKVPVAAIMVDLDHFKRLNDQFGHAAGDTILREAAGVIMSLIRGVDVACRYGGEELAVLLPDCTVEQAMVKAEQIRARINEISEPQGPVVSASLGVSGMPETSARVIDLLSAADGALYQAKQQGRDCVVAAPRRPGSANITLVSSEPRKSEP